ncbi:MAG: RNA polymerase sigma factor [bacterium]|nr:RNA polymerase sigma factor [bacterium]
MTLNFGNMVRLPRRTAETTAVAAEMGDRELFLQLLTPVKKHLYNFIRKSLNFSHDADDLFQDTLLKGFRYFHSFKRDRSFKTWIFTIAHNLMKDHFSAAGGSRSLVLLEDADNVPLEEDASVPSDVRDIYGVAKTLKPRQREIFFLYYYNEFKISEIVAVTGLTKFNVKFILHQARKAVKEMMEAAQ